MTRDDLIKNDQTYIRYEHVHKIIRSLEYYLFDFYLTRVSITIHKDKDKTRNEYVVDNVLINLTRRVLTKTKFIVAYAIF